MPTFVILSRISLEAFDDPKDFKDLAKDVSEKIKQQCPRVTWKDSFATLSRFDVVDIVEAADPKEVEKAAMLIRAYGHASTETLVATPRRNFSLRSSGPPGREAVQQYKRSGRLGAFGCCDSVGLRGGCPYRSCPPQINHWRLAPLPFTGRG